MNEELSRKNKEATEQALKLAKEAKFRGKRHKRTERYYQVPNYFPFCS
jgi:GNL3L/Grn1 putative GTPase